MKRERLEQIYKYIENHGDVSTQELTSAFGVSTMTIRRDLDELEEQGRIARFHGGAKITKDISTEASFELRNRTNHEQKMAIARSGIEVLKTQLYPNRPASIFIGSGSTIYCMASQLDVKLSMPIVTDNLYAATMLASSCDNTVIMVGGQLMLPSLSATGYLAEKYMSDLAIDVAFIGSSAIDEQGNLYAYNLVEAGMFSKIISVSKHVVVMADYSKLGQRNLVHVKKLDRHFTLITDGKAAPEYLQHYRELGTQVIVAEE